MDVIFGIEAILEMYVLQSTKEVERIRSLTKSPKQLGGTGAHGLRGNTMQRGWKNKSWVCGTKDDAVLGIVCSCSCYRGRDLPPFIQSFAVRGSIYRAAGAQPRILEKRVVGCIGRCGDGSH